MCVEAHRWVHHGTIYGNRVYIFPINPLLGNWKIIHSFHKNIQHSSTFKTFKSNTNKQKFTHTNKQYISLWSVGCCIKCYWWHCWVECLNANFTRRKCIVDGADDDHNVPLRISQSVRIANDSQLVRVTSDVSDTPNNSMRTYTGTHLCISE